jgi:hypothetical protein
MDTDMNYFFNFLYKEISIIKLMSEHKSVIRTKLGLDQLNYETTEYIGKGSVSISTRGTDDDYSTMITCLIPEFIYSDVPLTTLNILYHERRVQNI